MRRTMKRCSLIAVSALALSILAGCGSNSTEEEVTNSVNNGKPGITESEKVSINDGKKYPDSVTIFIEIHAKDGEEEFARQTLVTAIETTEKPGLLSYEIFEDSNDPGAFYSSQEWENIEAFQAHMGAVGSGKGDATAMLREEPKVSILKSIGRSPQ